MDTWIQALVISRLDYFNSLYRGLPQRLLHDLQLIMNDARVVKGLGRNPDISITGVLKDLHWLPMSERSKFKLISLVHKCVYGTDPTYMSAVIVKLPEPHVSSRSYYNIKLAEPRVKTIMVAVALVQWAPSYGTLCLSVFRMNLVFKAFKRSLKHTI